ncbi:MAG: FkbM family methyltransferase [Terracidiphilus sp.]
MNTKVKAAGIIRTLAGSSVFKKRLPQEFGGAQINVTARSDIRLLLPGLESSASDLFEVASRYIKRNFCVWDVGSNLGVFSFCSARKAGVDGKVYSLEADPHYVELQNKTIRSLPAEYAPVSPLCGAIANRMAILELTISKRGHSRNHLAEVPGSVEGDREERKQVVSITADFLLEFWTRPNFVKVDVEGAELLFLSGAHRLLSEVRPTLYIEVFRENQQQASDILRSFDYTLHALSPNGIESSLETCAVNTIAKPRERVLVRGTLAAAIGTV